MHKMITEKEFTHLAEKYLGTIYRVAYNWLKSPADAEDISQNVFLKLLQTRQDFESDAHAKYWLIRVCINECRDLTRRHWWHQPSIEDYAATLGFDSPQQSDLFYAVMALPKKYRLPIYLHYYEQYTAREIGEILRLPPNTVSSQLRRGRELLKKTYLEVEDHVE